MIELKTNTITPVTAFREARPIREGIVLFGPKPTILFTRIASDNYTDDHLYRVNAFSNDKPIDITPNDSASRKKIIGMAYNGKYVYYTSDKGNGTKTNTYRYDIQLQTVELVKANDTDYETMCWSRDQTHLLQRDQKNGDIYSYSFETKDRQKLILPYYSSDLKTVFFDPFDSLYYYIINKANDGKYYFGIGKADLSSAYLHEPITPGIAGVYAANLSQFGKYIHLLATDGERILETSTYHSFGLDGQDCIISPKETSVLSVVFDRTKYPIVEKIYLYDIAKKTNKELTEFQLPPRQDRVKIQDK